MSSLRSFFKGSADIDNVSHGEEPAGRESSFINQPQEPVLDAQARRYLRIPSSNRSRSGTREPNPTISASDILPPSPASRRSAFGRFSLPRVAKDLGRLTTMLRRPTPHESKAPISAPLVSTPALVAEGTELPIPLLSVPTALAQQPAVLVTAAGPSAHVAETVVVPVPVIETLAPATETTEPLVSATKIQARAIPTTKAAAPPAPITETPETLFSTAKTTLSSEYRNKNPVGSISTVKIPALPLLIAKTSAPRSASNGCQATEDPFGLQVLAEGTDPDVDLVAVHGLDGHREDSWTADNGYLWLRDYLPKNIPNVRISTWGYDGRTVGSKPLSCQSLHDHALSLITDLSAWRRVTNTQERPIIFITHGVGGIIVKDALIHSNAANKSNLEHHNAIKTSTCGVLFFGTPHQGTENMSWSQMLSNTTPFRTRENKALLRELEEHSTSLQKQLAQYNHISDHFETKFFYETYAPVGNHVIVPPGAAVLPGATNAETFAISSDHEGLVKYKTPNDASFKKVSLCISLMVDEAPTKILVNWERRRLVAAAEGNEGVQMTFEIPFELEYLRNSRFTGRQSQLDSLHALIKGNRDQSIPIILHGTGGIGKSQIVVEYLYTHKKEHSSIFWINAATLNTIVLGFRAAAQRLIRQHAKISLKSQPHYPTIAKSLGMAGVVNENGLLLLGECHNDCIINGMKLWFSSQENCTWVLVFDNVDDPENLSIQTFMPSPVTGTIIMTSRRPECADFGVGLEINQMSEGEGVSLLLRAVDIGNVGDDTALEITRRLGSLPLALAQAGAFIATRHITLRQYLEIYEESFKRAFAKKPLTGSWTYEARSILTTWEISFQAIKKENERAAELLSLCAFLFNEIQVDMLYRGGFIQGASDPTLDELMGLLYSYSLAQPQSTDGSFYIHPVVHRWAHDRLKHNERVQKTEQAVILVTSSLPQSKHKTMADWDCARGIVAHIDSVTKNTGLYIRETAAKYPLYLSLESLVKANHEWGRTNAAESLASQVYDTAREVLGKDHSTTTVAKANLAAASTRWNEVEKAELEVLETRSRTLGHEHPDTLSAMNNLARTYYRQGQQDKAEVLQLQVLEARKRIFGPEHPSTLSAISNLATTYCAQNRLDEAGALGLQAVEALKRTLGHEHPDTLLAIGNLAGFYNVQGRLDEAVTLQLQVVEANKRILGHEHPGTLSAMGNLAVMYVNQGQFDEARVSQLHILEIRKRTIGHDNAGTLLTMNNLAKTYSLQGRLDEAVALELQILEARKRILGHEHPDTLSTIGNLAAAYSHQGKLTEAYELALGAVSASERTLGSDHPSTIKFKGLLSLISRTFHNLPSVGGLGVGALRSMGDQSGGYTDDPLARMAAAADMHLLENRIQEAEQLLEQVREGRERVLGSEHPDTLLTMTTLASIYCTQKRWDEAENLQQQVVGVQQSVLGCDHTDTLSSMMSLASIYWNQEWWEKAEDLEQQVVDARKRVLGSEHPDTLSATASLAVSYRMQGQYGKAVELHREVMEATERLRGSEHPDTMTAVANLASTYGNQGRWDETEGLQKLVMDTRKRQFGKNHPDTQRAIANLAITYRKLGRHDDARNLRLQQVDLSQVVPSYRLPSTHEEMNNLVQSYISQHRIEDLQQLLIETAERRGNEDEITLSLMATISSVYKGHELYNEASMLKEQVIETLQKIGYDPEKIFELSQTL